MTKGCLRGHPGRLLSDGDSPVEVAQVDVVSVRTGMMSVRSGCTVGWPTVARRST